MSSLLVRIGADIGDFRAGMEAVNKSLQKTAKQVEGSMAGFRKMAETMSSVGSRLTAAISAPLAGVSLATMKAAADMESAETAMTTMLKSTAAAQAHLAELKSFAAQTPFQFTELVDASRRMQALGYSAKEVVPTLRTVGNAASALGMGAEGIHRIMLALGQMRMKGVASAEEMRQLTEAGIPAWDALAKKLGVDMAEAMALVQKRAVSSATAVEAVMSAMNERFAGGMEAQSKTLKGMWSNLQDAAHFALTDIGNVLKPFAERAIKDFLQPVFEKARDLAAAFAALPPSTQNAVVAIGALAVAAPPVIWGIGQLATMVISLRSAIGMVLPLIASPTGLTIAIGTGLVAGVVAAATHCWRLQKELEALEDRTKRSKRAADEWATSWETGWRRLTLEELKHKAVENAEAFKKLGAAVSDGIGITVQMGTAVIDAAGSVDGLGQVAENTTLKTRGLAETLRDLANTREAKKAMEEWMKTLRLAGTAQPLLDAPVIDYTPPFDPSQMLQAPAAPPMPLEMLQGFERGKKAIELVNPQLKTMRESAAKTQTVLQQFGQRMTEIFRDTSKSVADLIWKGGKLGEVLVDAAKEIGKAFTRIALEETFSAVGKQVRSLLKDVPLLGKALDAVFPQAAKAAGAAAGTTGAGTAAAGGLSSAAAGAASGLTGWLGAIGSIGSMVSGIVGNFQFAGMNKSLDLIEHETRYSQIHLSYILDKINRHLPGLDDLNLRMNELMVRGLGIFNAEGDAGLRLAGGAGGVTIHLSGANFIGFRDLDGFLDEIVRRLKQRGV
jgi:tape measure domain-containing protein